VATARERRSTITDDVEVLNVIEEGRVAHVAVESERGPHVVPLLYAAAGGRLWFVVAAGTLTARVTDPSARAGERGVVLTGTLQRIDPLHGSELVAARDKVGSVATALARFGLRNAVDLLAFGRDALRGRAGRLPPPRRVLLHFDPDRSVVVDGARVRSSRSNTPAPTGVGEPDTMPDPTAVAAVVALRNVDGPVPLPARWNGATASGWVEAALADATGVQRGPGDLTLDTYRAPGPAAKSGLTLRGIVEWCSEDSEPWWAFRLAVDRVTSWSGVEAETRRFG
jgi:hypothetical protein